MCFYINFNMWWNSHKKITLVNTANRHLLNSSIKPQEVTLLIWQEIPKYAILIY